MKGTGDTRRAPRPALRREDGAALVEFALVLPVLLLVLMGMLEFGRVFNYWIDENQLAGVGARWAAVNTNPGPGTTLAESVQQQADTNELENGGTTSVPDGVQVCVTADNWAVGEPVTVEASVDYNWMPLIGDALGGATTTTLTGSATMRLEAVGDIGDHCS
jgi:Flp pilus assembly protein TadG